MVLTSEDPQGSLSIAINIDRSVLQFSTEEMQLLLVSKDLDRSYGNVKISFSGEKLTQQLPTKPGNADPGVELHEEERPSPATVSGSPGSSPGYYTSSDHPLSANAIDLSLFKGSEGLSEPFPECDSVFPSISAPVNSVKMEQLDHSPAKIAKLSPSLSTPSMEMIPEESPFLAMEISDDVGALDCTQPLSIDVPSPDLDDYVANMEPEDDPFLGASADAFPDRGSQAKENDIDDLEESLSAISPKSRKSIKWTCRLFADWLRAHNSTQPDDQLDVISLVQLCTSNNVQLINNYLSKFISEVKRQDAQHFTKKTLNHIALLIQMLFKELCPGFELMRQLDTRPFREALQQRVRSSDVPLWPTNNYAGKTAITPEMDAELWQKGVLGCKNPRQLILTVYYLLSKYFPLKSRDDHRKLSLGENIFLCQDHQGNYNVQWKDTRPPRKYDMLPPRTYRLLPAEGRRGPEPCPVEIIKMYISLRPRDAPAFYCAWMRKAARCSGTWYMSNPVGCNQLRQFMRYIAADAGWDTATRYSFTSLTPLTSRLDSR